eukprot:Gregarina_sp_Poly_1__2584@NODE_16_length_22882_cov_82_653956_g14_i0_p2_GENE_NODE_16_length_22882_cov_82_653956_g14_i0NODE_16_length_22882_cov_82_653956_g14_i0_p2_ORF_typecomplete_len793_score120_63MTA70/PF05063_14/8_6e57BioT2/PF15368_6/0_049_NODE_16_length_22882_cov_82_653956_g14_i03562380
MCHEEAAATRPAKRRRVGASPFNALLREELSATVAKAAVCDPASLPDRRPAGTAISRDPLFHLPCSQVEIVRLFCLFCIELYTNGGTSKNAISLIDALDLAIPCSLNRERERKHFELSLLPADLAKQFIRRVNVQIVSSILRHWEKRSLIQLKKQATDRKSKKANSEYDLFDNYATVLKSVSIQGLTAHLCSLLQDVVTPAVVPDRPRSIYDLSPASVGISLHALMPPQAGVTGGSISSAVPPPPPPPTSSPSPTEPVHHPGVQQRLQTCISTPSVIELQGYQIDTDDSGEARTKALLEQPSFGDYLIRSVLIPLRSDPRFQFYRYCKHSGRDSCMQARRGKCKKLHYKRLIQPHTDANQGDCSYLDTCRHIFSCKFVHYALDITPEERDALLTPLFRHRVVLLNQFDVLERSAESFKLINAPDAEEAEKQTELGLLNHKETWFEKGVIENFGRKPVPPQWIRCDMRSLDLGIFKGLVSVVMADPPWDIRMDLPYGTLTDHEMKDLKVDHIQDEGLLFLWVTGRAMEIARDCMLAWGYRRVDELIWVKTNHLHRIIRTGRTGHWINHSKEHCLVGIKGNPRINGNIECDVIVSEVRETSRKPDEIYRMIERICPNGLKLELFGRQHNLRNNWITLGNQVDGVQLHTPELIKAFKESAGGMRQVCYEEQVRTRQS